MGTTFANLQVRNGSVKEILHALPGTVVKEYSDGWCTIVGEHFEAGQMDRIARALSRSIDQGVLSIEYFDDDLFRMALFREGKALTSHITENSQGIPEQPGKPKTFIDKLGFDSSETMLFREILACNDTRKKLELLECFLGVELRIGYHILSDATEHELRRERNLAVVEEAVSEMKKRKRIVNQTKAKLLMEFEGAILHSLGDNKYVIGMPPYDGTFEKELIYTFLPNGTLEPMLDVSPFQYSRMTGMMCAAHDRIAFFCYIRKKYDLFDYDGHAISETDWDNETDPYPTYMLEEGAFIAINNVAEYSSTLEKKWELPFLAFPVLVNPSHIYLFRDMPNVSSELLQLNRMGKVTARTAIHSSHTLLFVSKGCVIACYMPPSPGAYVTKIRRLTGRLEYIDELELGGYLHSAFLDPLHHRLFLYLLDQELVILDTTSGEVTSRRKWDGEDLDFLHADLEGRIALQIGNSTIILMDAQLQIISQHRLKGQVWGHVVNEAGNLCLLTGVGETHEERMARGMVARVYELVPLSKSKTPLKK